ncbi:MAG: DUF362 domain-containing protein, partial [bacterium]
ASSFLPLNALLGEESEPALKPVVWEVEGDPAAAVNKVFSSAGGLEKLIGADVEGATVLLKPNLCLPHPPASATTTSPELIDALCSYLVERKVKRVIVTDHTLQQAERFKDNALVGVAEKYKEAKLVIANEQRHFEPVEVGGKVLKKTEIMKTLERADLVINVATAKNHSATQVSLAIKNLMGVIWDRSAFHVKMDLHQAIGDLARAVRPGLNIIDASRVLLTGGPTGPGSVIKENRIFASTDILALDSIVAARYAFGGKTLTAREVRHLRAAYDNGVGEIDIEKIDLRKAEV